ncbi:LAFE_0F08614g1_1 [Lachancea fermentati]|uniref:S-formylglutathione hydrolase n=1 Tax=Lachancea fermentati TaxID=4955 RepID=A0A1G4MFK3_LACFM|nr:LAFE_0F08614g1_1 [Lachancea fermentati]
MSFKINQEIACCGGKLLKLSHQSSETKTAMDVNIYLPKQYYEEGITLIPVIYYLSGLTCSPQNATEKAFWQVQADKYGFAIVFPDTSPRGEKVPDDPEKGWDFGLAAGFYVDATQEPYKTNYRMFSYVHEELPKELDSYFNKENTKIDFLDNVAITGHSMGGFGALSGYLKYYNRYKSCSAFAPIANPTNVPWGIKALSGYLGSDKELWAQYDPCSLVSEVDNTRQSTILIHCGTKDPFLKDQLKPEQLQEAVKNTSWEGKIDLKIVEGFDHSYFFISTFVPEHAEFHAKNLGLI